MAESTMFNQSTHSTKFEGSLHHHHHQSMKNEVKLKRRRRSVRVIHATSRASNTNQRSASKTPITFKNNLVSFSTILSSRQDDYQQSSFSTQSLCQCSDTIANSKNIITTSPYHRSVSNPQMNDWSNDIKQNNISTSIRHIHQQEVDRDQTLVTKSSSKANKITHCEVDGSLSRNKSTTEYSTILNETKKRKKLRQWKIKFCCLRSISCPLLSLLICLLLTAAIVGTIVGVLFTAKAPTTSTIIPTMIPTTVPIIIPTTVLTIIPTIVPTVIPTTISTIIPTTIPTTIPIIIPTTCSCLCVNETWTFSLDLLARWSFDGTFNDVMKTYNATPVQTPSFVTNGYINQALLFNAAAIQSLYTSYIPLAYTSFTVEAWLRPTGFPNSIDHSILGLCPTTSADLCLQLVIRKILSNSYLYLSFFGDDCQGNTSITLNQWIHVAFVFDLTTLTQSIYLNGLLDNKCTASAPFMASMGNVTIGAVPALIPINNVNYFQGYIDHVSITKRAKSSCEIHEDATLAACFTFDATAPYTDSGPNSLLSNEASISIASSGHSLQAISFSGTSTSYFQALSFTGLGLSNKPFSIIFWIRPRSILTATLVHVSQNTLGTGWCYPCLGISTNGSLIAQVYNSGVAAIWGPSIPISPVWSHVVETWSQTNGLRLYVNSVLVASNASLTGYTASGVSDVVILASSRSGYNYCAGLKPVLLAPGPFNGDMDDFRLYSRELTATEVYTIYTS